MKQIKFFLGLVAISALFLVSCSKEEGPDFKKGSGKTYPVNFKTSLNFNSEINPLAMSYDSTNHNDTINPINPVNPGDSTSNPGDSTNIANIYYQYLVYNASGVFVKDIKGTGNSIIDELEEGGYKIAIVAATSYDFFLSPVNPSNFYTDVVSYPKAFYNSFDFYIDSTSNGTSNNTISLDRMWGEVNVEILDKATCIIPSNVKDLTVLVGGSAPSFFVKDGEGRYEHTTLKNTQTASDFRSNKIAGSFTSYSVNLDITTSTVGVSLVINYSDSTASKTLFLSTVKIKKGVRTTLKGNLGNVLEPQNQSQELNGILSLKEEWSNETILF